MALLCLSDQLSSNTYLVMLQQQQQQQQQQQHVHETTRICKQAHL
jgi:hypothetical protein